MRVPRPGEALEGRVVRVGWVEASETPWMGAEGEGAVKAGVARAEVEAEAEAVAVA